jgi:hypothetical protein
LYLHAHRATSARRKRRRQTRPGIDQVVAARRDAGDVYCTGCAVGDVKGLRCAERPDRPRAKLQARRLGGYGSHSDSGEANECQQVVAVVVYARRALNGSDECRGKRNFRRAVTVRCNTTAAVICLREVAAHHNINGLSCLARIADLHCLRGTRRPDDRLREGPVGWRNANVLCQRA